jgi:aryl-alcohol dehydrogenase-like predicted oxidoreductase
MVETKNYIHKLGLGSVQFGIDYGAIEKAQKTPPEDVLKILEIAKDKGVRVIDTARLYGDSEDVLGQVMPEGAHFDVVTKTLVFRKDNLDASDVEAFREAIETSLKRLKTDSLYGVILHHADDALCEGGEKLFDVMQEFKSRGAVSKIGASVYDAEQIDALLKRYSGQINLVQLPLNVFDQRLMGSGHLAKLKEDGVEIHVRSAFLQGLVFMGAENLPPKLADMRDVLMRFQEIAEQYGVSKAALALGFLMQNPAVDCVVCGVNTPAQFSELCENVEALPELENIDWKALAVNDPAFVNPSNW